VGEWEISGRLCLIRKDPEIGGWGAASSVNSSLGFLGLNTRVAGIVDGGVDWRSSRVWMAAKNLASAFTESPGTDPKVGPNGPPGTGHGRDAGQGARG
jgi:hypothetical protein